MGFWTDFNLAGEIIRAYVRIEGINTRRGMDNGVPLIPRGANYSQLPHHANIYYVIYRSKGGEPLSRGGYSLEYDLASNENILIYGYAKLKLLDIFSNVEDEI